MTKLHAMSELGQAVWLDYIRRSLITSGGLQALIDQGLRGLTSNPTIFDKAISGSSDYDADLNCLVEEGKSVPEIYEALALKDIGLAADLFRPTYNATGGRAGFVSLEVDPRLANDTEGTVAEARRLFSTLRRPNVMIKVPATPAGIPAIETLIGEGVNINVTLMFSMKHFEAVAEAYLAGLERLSSKGAGLSEVASVASFFVSRVDTEVDEELEKIGAPELRGKIAIANAKLVYQRFRQIFQGARWEALAEQGARVQRLLWGSTSTKNPQYPDTYYVDNLIGPFTVNTMPVATLRAFLDHGTVAPTIEQGLDEARSQLERLGELGITLDAITERLQQKGVAAFTQSFEALMSAIAHKRDQLLLGWDRMSATLGVYQPVVDRAIADMLTNRVVPRIWQHDHTVWKPEPTEITNRLAWLYVAEAMRDQVDVLYDHVAQAQDSGFSRALLMGMGGSSLAPDVFRRTYNVRNAWAEGRHGLHLEVLDSTDPAAVLDCMERFDPTDSLFIVSTKSGSTVETLSLFKYFYNLAVDAVGRDEAGSRFIAITDAGSQLAELAKRLGFWKTYINDPNIGGRYSALSYFGLVPAAFAGVDLRLLLDRAAAAVAACQECVPADDNWGARLGAIMGELAKAGRDKLTLFTSLPVRAFGDWIEQLIAESTGKEERGILPVVGEPLGPADLYGNDRLFVHLRLEADKTQDAEIEALRAIGHPVVEIRLEDRYDLGGQFFLWEMATAVAGARLGVNPFDQPNVEAAKVLAREKVEEYKKTTRFPPETPVVIGDEITVYGEVHAATPEQALVAFLSQEEPVTYVALQVYLQPTGEIDQALQELRVEILKSTTWATTVGYGPRYLHSTGQLHKGDAGRGLFIQFTADHPADAAIPDEAGKPESSISFGALIDAQALGDRQALANAGRRVMRFHLGQDPLGGLRRLTRSLLEGTGT